MAEEDKMQKLGIKYDETLIQKYKDIDDSRIGKNNDTCMVCFCEFELYILIYFLF